MRAIDHYRRAAEMVADVQDQYGAIPEGEHGDFIAAAQVHATLALAGATAMASYVTSDADELAEWELVAGGEGE